MKNLHRRWPLLFVLGCLPLVGLAQQAPARDASPTSVLPPGTASLSGIVMTDEASSRPVRRAAVTLSSPDVTGLVAVTDDAGRFNFKNLRAGRYLLGATRAGFIATSYGARRPGRPGTALNIEDGQRVTDVALKMLRGAVLTGT